MSREAMQMALDAFDYFFPTEDGQLWHTANDVKKIDDARQALQQALETEQEPVAWMHNFIENNVITHIPADIGRHPERWTPLYKDQTLCKTCQALAMAVMNDQTYHEKIIPKREWVGLTDEERTKIRSKVQRYTRLDSVKYGAAIQLATEQALKERNA